MTRYTVRLTREAQADLERLFDHVLERELASPSGRIELAEEALAAIRDGFKLLERFPFTCRKADASPFLRELLIPFGRSGYVALFEIEKHASVTVAAVRHQREEDFH